MILPDRATAERARALLGPVTAAYRHYDHPAGPGLFGTQSILGVREVGSLWHPPSARDETPPVERSGAKVFLPSSRGVRGGALVGSTTAGRPREIRFPADLLRRHHLYVARTRMGKSTLMHHIIVHKMREKAAGRDDDAIVVVDPHADLVAGLLEHVPASLANGMRLIDLADRSRSVGINLLDTRVFADRDRTADSMVRVTQGGCGGKDAAVRRAGLPDAVWRAGIDAHPRKAAVSRLDGRGRGADGEGLYAELKPGRGGARKGDMAMAARPVVWKGRVAKVAIIAVPYRDRSVLSPQLSGEAFGHHSEPRRIAAGTRNGRSAKWKR